MHLVEASSQASHGQQQPLSCQPWHGWHEQQRWRLCGGPGGPVPGARGGGGGGRRTGKRVVPSPTQPAAAAAAACPPGMIHRDRPRRTKKNRAIASLMARRCQSGTWLTLKAMPGTGAMMLDAGRAGLIAPLRLPSRAKVLAGAGCVPNWPRAGWGRGRCRHLHLQQLAAAHSRRMRTRCNSTKLSRSAVQGRAACHCCETATEIGHRTSRARLTHVCTDAQSVAVALHAGGGHNAQAQVLGRGARPGVDQRMALDPCRG